MTSNNDQRSDIVIIWLQFSYWQQMHLFFKIFLNGISCDIRDWNDNNIKRLENHRSKR